MPRILSLSLLILASAGCPPARPPAHPEGERPAREEVNEKARGPDGREVKSLKLPKSMIIGENVTLSGFYEDAGEAAAGTTAADQPTRTEKSTQVDVYRRVAPATVIINTPGGYGSGVLYREGGWILTNHHVIAHAAREEFRMKVSVSLGKLDARGAMERGGKQYVAHVHKQDPLRDLAVIKLVDPPPDLSRVKVSSTDPPPGQQVWAVGHAGIGLMWAVKGGQIAAVGKLSTHLAQLLLIDSQRAQAEGKGPLASSKAKLRARKLEKLKKQMERKRPALVIQSTCDISQGDSGGPLVNARGELVGLNAFIRGSYGTHKESNFHIHVSEVRKFIQEVPKDPPQLVPDPWTEGGSLARLGDADMDARVDVLALHRVKKRRLFSKARATGYFLDLDQDSFKDAAALPEVREVVAKRSIDAEVIFLEAAGHLYAWFDADNDGKSEVLLVAPAHNPSRVEGYRVDAGGKLSRDKTLDGKFLVRPGMFKDAALASRLRAMGQQLFNRRLLEGYRAGAAPPPDPVRGAGHHGKLRDLNRDGKPDTVATDGLFSSGYIMDLDQDSLAGFALDAPLKQVLEGGKVDAEFSWITRGRERWAWYDADNDGRFELLLHASRSPLEYADEAWQVAASGQQTPAPGFVGRKLIRPLLYGRGRLPMALVTAASRINAMRSLALSTPLGSFPDPARYHTWGVRFVGPARRKEAAINVRYSGCRGVLVDLDRDTGRKARKAKRSVTEQVRARRFDAEFARLRCGLKQWTFYDTRGAGAYDLVLYSGNHLTGKVNAAYRVDRKGKVSPRRRPIACKGGVHPALFRKRALRKALTHLAPDLFKPAPDLKCKP